MERKIINISDIETAVKEYINRMHKIRILEEENKIILEDIRELEKQYENKDWLKEAVDLRVAI